MQRKKTNDLLSQSTNEVNISKYSFPIPTISNISDLSSFLLNHPLSNFLILLWPSKQIEVQI